MAPSQRPATTDTRHAVARFNEAFNHHDVDAVMAACTEDTVLETTLPRPEGRRLAGAEVRQYWTEFFRNSPHAKFTSEEIFAAGDRCVVRWVYRWIDSQKKAGHVRGVDIFKVRDGKIAEKLVYVKG